MKKSLLLVTNDEALRKLLNEHLNEIVDIQIVNQKNIENQNSYDYGIIDSNCIQEFDKFIVSKKNIKENVVILTDGTQKKLIQMFLVNSIQMHDKRAPITSLLTKLFRNNIQSELKHETEENTSEKNNLYAFVSPAGGVGKSTMILNTALAMAKKNKKVLVVDFSTISAIEVNLGIRNHNNGLSNTLNMIDKVGRNQMDKISSIISDNLYKYVKKEIKLDLLFGASSLQMESIESSEIEKIILCVKKMDYDYVFFDTTSELSEKNLAILEMVEEVMLMSAADIGAGWKLIQYKEILDYLQIGDKCKLIINQYNPKEGFSCKELENQLNYDVLCVFPYDPNVRYYANKGEPIIMGKSNKFSKYICGFVNEIEPLYKKNEQKMLKVIH